MDIEREKEPARKRLLGWGLACEPMTPGLDLGRDLRLARGPSGVDLARVEGMDNLNQDLSIALTTLLGSDVFNTAFGFDGLNALAEETVAVLVQERVRVAIVNLLRKDTQIRRIVDVKLEDARLESPTPGERELSVRVTFETVTNDQAVVKLGKVNLNV